MAEMSADSLLAIDFDPRTMRYPYNPRLSWDFPVNQSSSPPATHWSANANLKRSTTPLEHIDSLYQPIESQAHPLQQPQHQPFIPQWPISQPSTAPLCYPLDNTYPPQFAGDYTVPYQTSPQYQTSPTDFMAAPTHLNTTLPLDGSYLPLGGQVDSMPLNWPPYSNDLMDYPGSNGLPDMAQPQQNLADQSPTDNYLEVRSLTNSSSDGWVGVDFGPNSFRSIDAFQDLQSGAISNPEQTLHPRSFSDSSYSDGERQSQHSWSSFMEVSNAIGSPGSDSFGEMEFYNRPLRPSEKVRPSPPAIVTSTVPKPTVAEKPISPQRSPISADPTRRQPRKTTSPKTTKSIIRRPTQPPKPVPEPSEKRVGRRKGPLRPEQRKQASEIRKLGACLRCKFLKKTVSILTWPVRETSSCILVRQRRTLPRLSTITCPALAGSLYSNRY